MPRHPHEPTPARREAVQLHATVGTPQDVIAQILGIDAKTLRKHYREELDLSTALANAAVGGTLFNKAKAGDTAAMIFWMKTRAGWKEKQEFEHTSPDGSMSPKPGVDLSKLSSEALAELVAARDNAPDK